MSLDTETSQVQGKNSVDGGPQAEPYNDFMLRTLADTAAGIQPETNDADEQIQKILGLTPDQWHNLIRSMLHPDRNLIYSIIGLNTNLGALIILIALFSSVREGCSNLENAARFLAILLTLSGTTIGALLSLINYINIATGEVSPDGPTEIKPENQDS